MLYHHLTIYPKLVPEPINGVQTHGTLDLLYTRTPSPYPIIGYTKKVIDVTYHIVPEMDGESLLQ